MKKDSIVVTVTDEALPDIQSVVSRLREKGMSVNQVHPITGVITGMVAPSAKNVLRRVEGVNSVEEELEVKLPPPHSELQ
jgi:hypothetical protein